MVIFTFLLYRSATKGQGFTVSGVIGQSVPKHAQEGHRQEVKRTVAEHRTRSKQDSVAKIQVTVVGMTGVNAPSLAAAETSLEGDFTFAKSKIQKFKSGLWNVLLNVISDL